ncbi:MAG: non-contractile tail sheath protein, partial [Sandaracinobacteroides sp.]
MVETPSYLAKARDQLRTSWVKRFRPSLWSVDFPRPMMAALTAPGPGLLRVDLDF